MKRKLALWLLIVVLGAIGYFGVRIYQEAVAEQAAQRRVQTLPNFTLVNLEGATVSRGDLIGEPAVLMFFRPSCPYCQHEAESIRANKALLDTARVVMISSRPASDLRAFVDAFRLEEHPRIDVLLDSSGAVMQTFGVDQVPKTFVYDQDESLLRQFEGEVNASALYSTISKSTP